VFCPEFAFVPGKESSSMISVETSPSAGRRLRTIGTATLMAGALIAWQAVPALAASAPESFSDLAKQVTPAVVNIQTTQTIQEQQEFQSPFRLPVEESSNTGSRGQWPRRVR
jgi:serine protease Do